MSHLNVSLLDFKLHQARPASFHTKKMSLKCVSFRLQTSSSPSGFISYS